MSSKDKPPLALHTRVTSEYGQTRLRTEVAAVQPSGELHYVRWSRMGWDHGYEYDGFSVTAYIGYKGMGDSTDRAGGVWGITQQYAPHHIEFADHARTIVKVLARIERGLSALNASDGYLADDNYSGYVLRIGRILRIPLLYVNNSLAALARTGQHYRPVDGSGLQSWVATVASDVEQGKIHEYVRR